MKLADGMGWNLVDVRRDVIDGLSKSSIGRSEVEEKHLYRD